MDMNSDVDVHDSGLSTWGVSMRSPLAFACQRGSIRVRQQSGPVPLVRSKTVSAPSPATAPLWAGTTKVCRTELDGRSEIGNSEQSDGFLGVRTKSEQQGDVQRGGSYVEVHQMVTRLIFFASGAKTYARMQSTVSEIINNLCKRYGRLRSVSARV